MKILYHVGKTIGAETIVKKGVLVHDRAPMMIEAEDEKIVLNGLQSVEFYRLDGLGTMVKILNNTNAIYLTVPRIYINIGTGFAIINSIATRKMKGILDEALGQ